MRILATADIHGNCDVYRAIRTLGEERQVDALVLAGDLLGMPDELQTVEEAQRANGREICEVLSGLNIPVLYIMGNDDLVELEPPGRPFQSIHGRRFDLEPYNFVGYQFSLPFMGGIFEKPEEEIAADLSQLESLMDANTVFVTHSPAKGILDKGILDISAGSPSILDVIRRRRVRAHIHGHVHSCFGREGCHFNVAAAAELRAMVLDMATLQHEVITPGVSLN